jgi:predicted acetyltransferase
MHPTEIRAVTREEMLDILYWLSQYSFHPSPPMIDKAEWSERVGQRRYVSYYALFEDGEPQACAAGAHMTQNIRGALRPMTGIWGVVTHPRARRKGYSRSVLAALLTDLHSKGFALSCLYPFRESFYERMGYVTLPLPRIAHFDTRALAPLLKAEPAGEIEMGLSGDTYEPYWAYMQEKIQRVHGMALFDQGEFINAKENRNWLALAKIEAKVEGVMLYQLLGDKVTEFTFKSFYFYYNNSQARYLLLDWIARHIDQASQVELWLPAYELPETWLSDLKLNSESQVRAPMGRVLDVSQLSGIQTGPGSFTAHIHDPICTWNQGVWRFESGNGCLQVMPGKQPDCELSIQALAGLVYGTHDPGDFPLRGWGNPNREVQAVIRSIFPPQLPHLHSYF